MEAIGGTTSPDKYSATASSIVQYVNLSYDASIYRSSTTANSGYFAVLGTTEWRNYCVWNVAPKSGLLVIYRSYSNTTGGYTTVMTELEINKPFGAISMSNGYTNGSYVDAIQIQYTSTALQWRVYSYQSGKIGTPSAPTVGDYTLTLSGYCIVLGS